MSGIQKFQVHVIKRSRSRMFTNIPILFWLWFSSTELLAFLICTQLVLLFSVYNKSLTFFSQTMISDDAAELPLAMKWVSVVVMAYSLGKSLECLIIVHPTSSACIPVQRLACLLICGGTGDAVEKIYTSPWSLPHTTMKESSAKTPALMHLLFVRTTNV